MIKLADWKMECDLTSVTVPTENSDWQHRWEPNARWWRSCIDGESLENRCRNEILQAKGWFLWQEEPICAGSLQNNWKRWVQWKGKLFNLYFVEKEWFPWKVTILLKTKILCKGGSHVLTILKFLENDITWKRWVQSKLQRKNESSFNPLSEKIKNAPKRRSTAVGAFSFIWKTAFPVQGYAISDRQQWHLKRHACFCSRAEQPVFEHRRRRSSVR